MWPLLPDKNKKLAISFSEIANQDLEASLQRILGHPEDIDYFLNLYGRAGPELFPLSLVSMWHERETRYPPIETRDYWNPDDYTSDKGLSKTTNCFTVTLQDSARQ